MSNQQESEPHRPQATVPTSFWDALGPVEQHVFRSLADERTFASGARIMREGERAHYVMVILSGQVEIWVDDNGTETVIAQRGPGQLVGERAILDVNVRSATVLARGMVHALVMNTEDFAAYVSARPAVFAIVEGQLVERRAEDPARYHSTYIPFVQVGGTRHARAHRFSSGSDGNHRFLRGQNCTIIYSDVVAFSSPDRSDEHRNIIRRETLEMTASSLREIWDQCSYDDRGDGLLIVVPPHIPTAKVLDYLLAGLPKALKRHNSIYGPGASIQLRVALDVGPVTSDDLGESGQVIINAARLLEARDLKDAVAASRANLGIIVSEFVYKSVVSHDDSLSEPGAFREIDVRVKEATLQGWMRLIDPGPRTRRRSLTTVRPSGSHRPPQALLKTSAPARVAHPQALLTRTTFRRRADWPVQPG